MHYFNSNFKKSQKFVYFAMRGEPTAGGIDDIDQYVQREGMELFECIPPREYDNALKMLQNASANLSSLPLVDELGYITLRIGPPVDFKGKQRQEISITYRPNGNMQGRMVNPEHLAEIIDETINIIKDSEQEKQDIITESQKLYDCIPPQQRQEALKLFQLVGSRSLKETPIQEDYGHLRLRIESPSNLQGKELQIVTIEYRPSGNMQGRRINPEHLGRVIYYTIQKLQNSEY